jgi:HlyD family secretion protein
MNAMRRLGIVISLALAAMLVLPACQAGPGGGQATATPGAALEVQSVVSATGVVVPKRWTSLAVAAGGVVENISVKEGDQVKVGDALLQLEGGTAATATLEAAKYALESSRQALDTLKKNAELDRTNAQLALAQARDAFDKAEKHYRYQQAGNRASSETIRATEADLVLAKQQVEIAQKALNSVSGLGEGDPKRAAAEKALYDARHARDLIQANLNWYKGKPTSIDQALLDAEYAQAEQALLAAERAWEKVQNGGPDPDALALAQGAYSNAQAQVSAAQQVLDNLTVRAPYDGTVTHVYPHLKEFLAPAQPAIDIGDLTSLQVETTDLNEIDVARIGPGSTVSITFDALPDVQVSGLVESIAVRSSAGAGVNYRVVVSLDEIPERLRWGMTAFVDITVSE